MMPRISGLKMHQECDATARFGCPDQFHYAFSFRYFLYIVFISHSCFLDQAAGSQYPDYNIAQINRQLIKNYK